MNKFERHRECVAKTRSMLASGRVLTAETIAKQVGRSVRTVHRYITTLRAAGEDIRGEAGVGYLMAPQPRHWEAP